MFTFSFLGDYLPKFLEGVGVTLGISLITVFLGTLLGSLLFFMKSSDLSILKIKPFKVIATVYIEVIRGTPMLLQILMVYSGTKLIFGIDVTAFSAAIIAIALNSSAYVSEIIKSGIISIDKGQFEASNVLGLNYVQAMYYVVLPQAIRNILPALGNEFITLLKETSVAGYIGICELTKASDIIASRTYDYFFPLIIIAIIYFTMTYFLSRLINVMERKLNNARS